MDFNLKVTDSGDLVDSEGTSWTNLDEYVEIKILDLCGCGNPSEIREYVRSFLQKVELKHKFDYCDLSDMFMLNWLNHKNFTKHGTTVRCSWLTEDGKLLLRVLNELKERK